MRRKRQRISWEKSLIRIWKCHLLGIIRRCWIRCISLCIIHIIYSCTILGHTATDRMLLISKFLLILCQSKMKKGEFSLLVVENQERQLLVAMSLLKKDLFKEEICCLREEHIHFLVCWLRNRKVKFSLLEVVYHQRVWTNVKYMMFKQIHGHKLQILILEEISIRR